MYPIFSLLLTLGGPYAGSATCTPCHAAAAAAWADSHHARAERAPTPAERAALARAPDPAARRATRVLGVAPLWQPLIHAPDGRLQVSHLAYEPARAEWFEAFAEARTPGTWSHWTGRGMTWNIMCVDCHNTGVTRGWDDAAQRYDTQVVEHGVGCEACHGPAAAHVAAPEAVPVPVPGPTIDTCAPCHSRRASLTAAPPAGGAFLDAYAPLMPGHDALYWPDGQVRDEDFEYTSFLGSRMHQAGVTCVVCHDSHTGKTRRAGDALCTQCHDHMPGFERHDHHPAGGATCVDCHMPSTTYMQRHPRRDHGFGSPDPRLTVERGVPNACTRCHTEQTPRWALARYEAWYGADETPRQSRGRTLAALVAGDRRALPTALEMSAADRHPHWRARALGYLAPFTDDAAVRRRLVAALTDAEPLVRLQAATALGRDPAVASLLGDPVRAVRVQAARAVRAARGPEAPTMADYRAYLQANADQPQAAFEWGTWLLERGDAAAAEGPLRRAAEWDPSTPDRHFALGLTLARLGRTGEARAALARAADQGHAAARTALRQLRTQ